MFEAERVLMTDNVIIPIYSYVTKRLVNPHLQGWQPNVMDHHLTRYMFKLRTRLPGEETAPPPAAEETAPGLTPLEDLPTEQDGVEGPATVGAELENPLEPGTDTLQEDVPDSGQETELEQPEEGSGG